MPSRRRQSARLAEPQGNLRRHLPLILAMLVSGLAATAFGWRTLDAGFIMGDDQRFVTDHFLVNHPSIPNAWTLLTIPHGDLYQPIPMLSFQANYAAASHSASGVSPVGFHLTNVVLHAINAMLAVLLAAALSRRVLFSGLTGILFATHPMAMETVAWVSGRMILLATLFALVVLILAVRRPRSVSGVWGISITLSWIVSLASKVLPTVPIVAYAFDRASHRTGDRKATWTYAALFAVGIAAVGAMSILTHAEGFTSGMHTSVSGSAKSLLLAASQYVDQYFVPTRLSPWTPPLQDVAWNDSRVIVAFAKLGLLLALIVILRKRAPIITAGLLAFALLLAPFLVASLARRLFVADRYMYLPMIGLHLAVVETIAGIVGRLKKHQNQQEPAVSHADWIAAVPLVALAVWWFTIAINLAPVWRNTVTYAERVVECFPNEPDAHNELARAFLFVDRPADALSIAMGASNRWPENPRLIAQVGESQSRLGDHASALIAFDQALKATPDHTRTRYLRAVTLQALGRRDDAKAAFQSLITDQPEFLPAYGALARIYQAVGNTADLRSVLQKAIQINPHHRDNTFELAMLDYTAGRLDEAERGFRRLVELNPADAPALLNLGAVLARMGRNIEAVRCYDRLLTANPRETAARFNRGDLLLALGQTSDAEQDYRAILKSDPSNLDAATRIHQLLVSEQRWQALRSLWEDIRRTSSAESTATDCYILWAQSLIAMDLHDPLPAAVSSLADNNACTTWIAVYVNLRTQNAAALMDALDRIPESPVPAKLLDNHRRIIMGAFEDLPIEARNSPAGLFVAARLMHYFHDTDNAIRFLEIVRDSETPWSQKASTLLLRLNGERPNNGP